MKLVQLKISDDLHKNLKIGAISDGVTLQKFVQTTLEKALEQRNDEQNQKGK